jgi:hypothetical protein
VARATTGKRHSASDTVAVSSILPFALPPVAEVRALRCGQRPAVRPIVRGQDVRAEGDPRTSGNFYPATTPAAFDCGPVARVGEFLVDQKNCVIA